jgi:NAD(P)-dependent dehydrogenase (short-subunit alcohol dehydrogenase family)
MRFQGKVAIVTGSSTEIGEAIALAFGREGADVVLAARTMERLHSKAERIRGLGGRALPVKTDISRL